MDILRENAFVSVCVYEWRHNTKIITQIRRHTLKNKVNHVSVTGAFLAKKAIWLSWHLQAFSTLLIFIFSIDTLCLLFSVASWSVIYFGLVRLLWPILMFIFWCPAMQISASWSL